MTGSKTTLPDMTDLVRADLVSRSPSPTTERPRPPKAQATPRSASERPPVPEAKVVPIPKEKP